VKKNPPMPLDRFLEGFEAFVRTVRWTYSSFNYDSKFMSSRGCVRKSMVA
jgi:hypothetical protein